VRAFILAGGASRRFGSDKTLFKVGGEPLILRIYRLLSERFPTAVVAKDLQKYERLGIKNLVADPPESPRAPLSGIVAALRSSDRERNLIVAADMPLLCPEFLEFVKESAPSGKISVPEAGGKLHFLAAVYPRSLLPEFESALKRGELALKNFLPFARVWSEEELKRANVRKECFFNLNRREELDLLRRFGPL